MGVVAATVLGGGRVKADFTFGEPTNLGPIVNSSFSEWPPSISADDLTLCLNSNRTGEFSGTDIWVMVDHWQTDDPFFDNGNFELHKWRFSYFNGKFISRLCGNDCFGVWPKHNS